MTGARDLFRAALAELEEKREPAAAVDVAGLRCDACGALPAAGLAVKVGDAHFRRVQHGVGIPGRAPTTQLRTCGKYRAREPGEEG